MKRSRLSYDEWKCIISKDIFGKTVNSELLNGYIGLIDITHTSHTKNRHIIGSYATLGI